MSPKNKLLLVAFFLFWIVLSIGAVAFFYYYPKSHSTNGTVIGTKPRIQVPINLPPPPDPAVLQKQQSARRQSAETHEQAIIAAHEKKPAEERPDEELLALATEDWDESFAGLVFSPDSKILAGLGVRFPGLDSEDYCIRFWEIQTGQLWATIVPRELLAPPLVFSPDGKLLAAFAGGHDRAPWKVLVWDMKTGNRIAALALPAWTNVRSLMFSPDGKMLTAVGVNPQGSNLHWWTVEGWEPLAVPLWADELRAAAFSHDGRYFAAAKERTISILRLPKLFGTNGVTMNNIGPMRFSPNLRWLAAGSGRQFTLIKTANWSPRELAGDNILHVEFIGDGDMIVVSRDRQSKRIYKTRSLEVVADFYEGGRKEFAFSPGGLLMAGTFLGDRPGVGVWTRTTLMDDQLNQAKGAIVRSRFWREVAVNRHGTDLQVFLSDFARDGDMANVATLPNVLELDMKGRISDRGLAFLKDHKALRSLYMDGLKNVTDRGLEPLKKLSQLEELALVNLSKLEGAGLRYVQDLSKLHTLKLTNTKVFPQHYQYLKNLTNLEFFDPGTFVTDKVLEQFAGMTKLQALGLYATEISDDGLKHLAGMTEMRTLNLAATRIGDKGLKALQPMQKLEWLDLSNSRVANLDTLPPLPKLALLKLAGSNVNDTGIANLAKLPALREVWLDRLPEFVGPGLAALKGTKNLKALYLYSTGVTDKGFEHIAKLKHLKALGIPKAVTNVGIEHLGELTQLEWLSLNEAITDTGLPYLQKLKKLKVLELHDSKITDKGLSHLAELTSLEEVKLNGTSILGSGLVHLQKLPKLVYLNLSNTKITDIALTHVQRLKKLEYLELKNTKITEQGLDRLRTVLPNTEVVSAP